MRAFRTTLAAWLAAGLVVACGSEPSAPPDPRTEEEPAPPEPLEPPAPPVTVVGEGRPPGFEPMLLPPVADACDGPIVWVGVDVVSRAPAMSDDPSDIPGRSELTPGVAREVHAAMQSTGGVMGVLAQMTSAYNGPGGEPLFRWHLERTGQRPVLFFDRRISSERLLEALRGAAEGVPLRVGGVDEDGGRRCAVVLAEEPADLEAQSENALYAGHIDPEGALRARGPDTERELDAVSPGAPLADEPEHGLHIIRIEASEGADAATLVRALVSARWAERRYGWLALPPQVPHCLPLVSGCGCAEGCARGLALLDGPARPTRSWSSPLEGSPVRVQVGPEAPQEAHLQRWCFEAETGRMTPVGDFEGSDCFDVYVIGGECGGECVPREKPDCAACEACDLSCAGAPVRDPG